MTENQEKIRWEWRAFWRDKCPFEPEFKSFSFLEKKPVEIIDEKNTDTYLFIQGSPLNIKLRDGDISYKVLLEEKDGYHGYSKKQAFDFPLHTGQASFIPGLKMQDTIHNIDELQALLEKTNHPAKIISIVKDRRTAILNKAKDDRIKKAKSEFATVEINGKRFQTLSVESRHKKWLQKIVPAINTNGAYITDYIGLLTLIDSGRI